jgi:hypothetical protein
MGGRWPRPTETVQAGTAHGCPQAPGGPRRFEAVTDGSVRCLPATDGTFVLPGHQDPRRGGSSGHGDASPPMVPPRTKVRLDGSPPAGYSCGVIIARSIGLITGGRGPPPGARPCSFVLSRAAPRSDAEKR